MGIKVWGAINFAQCTSRSANLLSRSPLQRFTHRAMRVARTVMDPLAERERAMSLRFAEGVPGGTGNADKRRSKRSHVLTA